MATQDERSISASLDASIKTDEYRALYQLYLEYCNAHNFEAMKSFYTSPLSVNDESWSPDKVTAQFQPIITAFPDWHWEMRNLTIQGDYLALHFKVTGTHLGDFQGIKATGRRVAATQFTLYHVVDGKFAEVWDLTDIQSIIEQIS